MTQIIGTVLVIEDDTSIREAMCDFLEMEGFHVEYAVNGKEGLELLEKMECPCLIILDLFMPVMDGAQFLSELKTKHLYKVSQVFTVPVILLSAATSSSPILSKARPLVQEFIKKPIDLDGFLNKVKQYCKNKKETEAA